MTELSRAQGNQSIVALQAQPIVSTTVPNQVALDPPVVKVAKAAKRGGFLGQYFYFSMSLFIAAVLVYGFSHTIDQNLIRPREPRSFLLYVHAAVFSSWLVCFILRNVRVHRTIGWFGVALGVAITLLGIGTAVTMARFNSVVLHHSDGGQVIVMYIVTENRRSG